MKQVSSRRVIIMYGTCTGRAEKFALNLSFKIKKLCKINTKIVNLNDYDEEMLEKEDIVLIICSTWNDGSPPATATRFFNGLQDFVHDFRVSKNHLNQIHYSIFGLGGEIYNENFCKCSKQMDEFIFQLSGNRITAAEFGDDSSDLELQFQRWNSKIILFLQELKKKFTCDFGVDTMILDGMYRNEKNKKKEIKRNYNPVSKHLQKTPIVEKDIKYMVPFQMDCVVPPVVDSNPVLPVESQLATVSKEASDEGDEEEEEDRINNQFMTMDRLVEEVNGIVPKEEPKMHQNESCQKGDSCSCASGVTEDISKTNYSKEESGTITTSKSKADLNGIEEFGVSEEKGFEVYSDDDNEEQPFHGVESDEEVDMEDIGQATDSIKNHLIENLLESDPSGVVEKKEPERREMVTKLQRKSLIKEGYRIIGTHSAVKLCRWTKHQMRGRGGCYKHTFFGITSYQCMEATPSLACANKCVFCWRHHKNPVGTDWRWKEDEPGRIVEEAITLHRSMIYEMRGVPGVLPDRLQEANTVKHCALSLVGEPIMYPRINEMLWELHRRHISSFLVTNAQFPDRIDRLDPVTQLYVSVDASTKDSLKAIDRPLFKDFWERFLASLHAMKSKQQRTVYRMTLVKSWNMEELEGYVELIEAGEPDFIEIKGVTYCGKSDASTLTMENVPWHYEVCSYAEAICKTIATRQRCLSRGVQYEIATEHEHSCCILLARVDKFKVNGEWYTWINYGKFHQLMYNYYVSRSTKGAEIFSFSSVDYMEKTPEWALYKSKSRGFDPEEQRYRKNKAGILVEQEYKPSGSGCG